MKPKANTSKEMKRDRRAPAARSKTMEAKEGSVSSPPEARADTAPDPRVPSSYPRRILLAVTGLSPQVVTETLHALAVTQSPAFVPTDIYLITTREGAERARLALLSEEPGWFHRLCRDFGLPEIRFNARHIHVLTTANGVDLDDIRTLEDNRRAADFITEQVRALTVDPNTALHVSIAGGRKTMGFYLGYALSLYGRPPPDWSTSNSQQSFEQVATAGSAASCGPSCLPSWQQPPTSVAVSGGRSWWWP